MPDGSPAKETEKKKRLLLATGRISRCGSRPAFLRDGGIRRSGVCDGDIPRRPAHVTWRFGWKEFQGVTTCLSQ
ncbi:MAG TPA: hypothetical protein DCZ61_08400 [Lachnospiraceae bacterium]|nr:hypothetical protein [Lachnospiraceae bacterium]